MLACARSAKYPLLGFSYLVHTVTGNILRRRKFSEDYVLVNRIRR
mgnify:CR=1